MRITLFSKVMQVFTDSTKHSRRTCSINIRIVLRDWRRGIIFLFAGIFITLTISRSPSDILIYFFLQLQTKPSEERVGEYSKARKTRPFTLLALCHQVCIFVRDGWAICCLNIALKSALEIHLLILREVIPKQLTDSFIIQKQFSGYTQAIGYTVVCRTMWTMWRVWNQAATAYFKVLPWHFLEVLRKTTVPSR